MSTVPLTCDPDLDLTQLIQAICRVPQDGFRGPRCRKPSVSAHRPVVKTSLNVTTLKGWSDRLHSKQGYQSVRQWLPEPDGGDYQVVRTGLAPELLRMTHLGPLPPETIEH
jgi:hypothetical protein